MAPYRVPSESPADRRRPRLSAELIGTTAVAAGVGVDLLDLSDDFADSPVLGVTTVALICGSATAIGLILHRDRRGWVLGGLVALAAVVTQMVTLGAAHPDTPLGPDRWTHPFSLLTQSAVVVIAAIALRRTRSPRVHDSVTPSLQRKPS